MTRSARVDDAATRLQELKASGIDAILDPTALGLGRYIPRIGDGRGPDRSEDHRGHRPVHVQRAARTTGAPRGPGSGPGGSDPMVNLFVQGHHRGHRRHGHQGRRDQVRHRPAGHHPGRRARPAGLRPDPPGHRCADHHPHRCGVARGAWSSRRSSSPKGVDLTPRRHRPQRRHRGPRLPRGADRQRQHPRHGPLRHRRPAAHREAGAGHRRAVPARLRRPHGAEPRRVVLPRLDPRRDPAVGDGRTGTTSTSATTCIPALREAGVTDAQIDTMLVDTPRRFLENTGAY